MARALGAALIVLLSAGVVGCDEKKPPPGDGGMDRPSDGPTDLPDVPVDKPDAGGGPDANCAEAGAKKSLGQSCACASDCNSGFCADGVCCSSACTDACKTCSASGSEGTCVNRTTGADPRTEGACVPSPTSSCGLDGKCDGLGTCRKHEPGTVCRAGSCENDTVVGAFVCDGKGQCKPGATIICFPFSCDVSAKECYAACSANSQCASNQVCQDYLCGKKMKGARCTTDSECASGFCTDNVCCNVSCKGACQKCSQPGREGTCFPVERGVADPHLVCQDQGQATCGRTGTCDGLGGCARYARDTKCADPTCSGNRLNTTRTCDGLGTCRSAGLSDCDPFRCVNGACTNRCESDADCAPGIACVATTCGPKQKGQVCETAGECASNYCVDGVCCESSCQGACRSCAIPSSPGSCMAVAVGNIDPRGVCKDEGVASCKNDGKCDGSGSCQTYAVGIRCADESCSGNVYNPPSTCNASGQCAAPDSVPCRPYICNGKKCFDACGTDGQCASPNVCRNSSCGPKPPGASCSAATECDSGFCEQGTCCQTSCQGPCRDCSLTATAGTCSPVMTGADPAGLCADEGANSCGTNGSCSNGACQRYTAGTVCRDPNCPVGTTTSTAVSTCDGSGTCVTPGAISCFPYQCGGATCKGSCTSDNDCASPAVCINGSCGRKPPGLACASGIECASGFCAQGFCCQSACGDKCKSCALQGSLGTCTNVASGDADPKQMCGDLGPGSCSTDGFCDGNGGCRLYDAATSCAPPTCPLGLSTATSGRTCDGRGSCQAPTVVACAPYVCNGTNACRGACTSDADCLSPNICDPLTNLCGNKRRLGQSCSTTNDCLTGASCVDAVCCSASACPTCQACNVTGSRGNCANVPLNAVEPHGGCTPTPPCGNTGSCNGAGACQLAGTSVACGTASCTGSTFTPVSHCNGTGGCAAPTASSCGFYVCGPTACRTTCTADADCVAPNTCQGGNCALKPNGISCITGNQCISGFCTDGVCCGSASCPTCQACNVNGAGSCANIAAGLGAPPGQCPVSPPCGNTGACNGAGACQQAATTVSCGSASCAGSTFTPVSRCTGTGSCAAPTTSTCAPYVCGTNACRTTCQSNADCISSSFYCTGAGGTCMPKKPSSVDCASDNECGTGFCTDGVCCGVDACATCQACNVTGSRGVCANAAAGTSSPGCAPNPPCGNTGTCDGVGACQQAATTVSCGTASCSGSTYSPVSNCNGSGGCATPTTSTCAPYVCGTNACRTTCQANADCISTSFYCTGAGGTCQPKKGSGQPCGSANECGTGFCTNGACCGVAACPTCQACNITGNGTCSNVTPGTASPGCTPSPPCGNTGTCDGAGACQQAATTISCGSPSCTGSTHTPLSHCNGSGGCAPPTTTSCAPYVCGNGNACRNVCMSNADCISTSFYCTGAPGSCLPKKASGQPCASATECGTNFCTDGVCCGVADCPTCQACNIASNPGICSSVPAGTSDSGCPTGPLCGNTGACNGAGSCAQAPPTVQCGNPSCTGAAFTPAAFCSGSGTCANPGTLSCGNYVCGTNACRTTCATDVDCTAGSYCTGPGGNCLAKKASGATCGSAHECGNDNCVDGVCCSSPSCPTCQACNVAGSAGTCANVGVTPEPHGRCPVSSPCGNTGSCNGAGACQQTGSGVQCGGASCTGTTFTPAAFCSGTGTCGTPATQSCAPYLCGTTSCRVVCTSDADCTGGNFCTGPNGSCVPKRSPGTACTLDNECGTGHCTDGVCCTSAACGTCQSCSINGNGTCATVTNGDAEPHGQCPSGATCGNTGLCFAGACQQASTSVQCNPPSCTGTTLTPASFCSGTGTCSTPAGQTCAPYVCGTGACRNSCNSDGDCSAGYYCTGVGGSCLAKKAPGSACAVDNECGTGNCTDGACCTSDACGTCQSCSVNGNGTCANVANNAPEPHGACPASPPCGNVGTCNGAGACRQAPSTNSCSASFCAGSIFHPTAFCSGGGSCSLPATVDCGAFACTASGCRTSCGADTDCAAGNYCTGTGGTCLPTQTNGVACTVDSQCASGHCTDGYCCGITSCLSCQSCGVPGSQGTCTNVPAGGTDPTGTCVDETAANCNQNGLCNGSGGCALYAMGTVCNATCASNGSAHTTYTCSAPRSCTAQPSTPCASNMCNAATGCAP